MKKLLTFLFIVLFTVNAFGGITVPFRCHENLIVKYFKEEGYNFDKTDFNSDGFIENCGKYYKIHFYEDPKDLGEFLKIHMKIERRIQEVTCHGYRDKI